jgi:Mlc titration factor MtfA (ptsG expression regulator)
VPLEQVIESGNSKYLPMEISFGIVLTLVLAIILLAKKGRFPEWKIKKVNKVNLMNLLAVICCVALIYGIAFTNITVILLAVFFLMRIYFSDAFQNANDTSVIEFEGQNPLAYSIPAASKDRLIYQGSSLEFPNEVLQPVLTKYLPFYAALNNLDKEKFIERLRKFISKKTFVIHDESGYREMPVLVSAAAVQLSFGLNTYMLPSFHSIHIYPAEFIRTDPDITFLIGNVSNNCINISWKHFLSGFANPDNGENVGLHEMAHAYYYQNFATDIDCDAKFTHNYSGYGECSDKIFEEEKIATIKLFTDYGLSSKQEFWAESIEIFFEKPEAMQQAYPALYACMCQLLNQYPNAKILSA